MKIHIQKNLWLEADQFQFILREYQGTYDKRDGREKGRTVGYYTSLSGVVNKLIKINLADSEAETLIEMRDEVHRISLWAKKLFEGHLEPEGDADADIPLQ